MCAANSAEASMQPNTYFIFYPISASMLSSPLTHAPPGRKWSLKSSTVNLALADWVTPTTVNPGWQASTALLWLVDVIDASIKRREKREGITIA